MSSDGVMGARIVGALGGERRELWPGRMDALSGPSFQPHDDNGRRENEEAASPKSQRAPHPSLLYVFIFLRASVAAELALIFLRLVPPKAGG